MSNGEGLARRVAHALEGIPRRARRLGIDPNGGWMPLIKSHLAQLADELRYDMHAPATGSPNGGDPLAAAHPYDLTWSAKIPGGKRAARLPLVLDFGWHSSRGEQIDDDFQELLAAPAELRVLIFQQRTAAAVQALMDDLERRARTAPGPEPRDVYLLCGYDWDDTQQFAFRTFTTA